MDIFKLQALVHKFANYTKFIKQASLITDEIEEGMAHALFAMSWADSEREEGREHGGRNILDVMPSETPPSALHKAHETIIQIEKMNNKSMDELFVEACEADGEEADPKNSDGHWE
jgi:hypothetical protein